MDIRGKKCARLRFGYQWRRIMQAFARKNGADVVLYDGNEKLCADEIELKF